MKRSLGYYFNALGIITKTSAQLLYGFIKISRLPEPIVTIFGGSRLAQDSFFAKQAHALSHRLAQSNISVITGGGPGIMQAANCGVDHEMAHLISARTLGITVRGLEPINECAQNYIVMDYFFSRKWLMINFARAFAIFPGGFGTIDELAEVITLLQTKKLSGVPVVLIGKNYWQPLLNWLNETVLKHGLIGEKDLSLIKVTDDLDEALCLLQDQCETQKEPVHQLKKEEL